MSSFMTMTYLVEMALLQFVNVNSLSEGIIKLTALPCLFISTKTLETLKESY